MEENGTAATLADGAPGPAADAPGWLGAWYYWGAALLWYAYPFVVLVWTVSEGAFAARDGRGQTTSSWRAALRRCLPGGGGRDDVDKPGKERSPVEGRLGGGLELIATGARWLRYTVVLLVLATRLIVYSLMFAPWFLQIGYAYFHDARILRGVRYGAKSRNYVDIYIPPGMALDGKGAQPKLPVVVTVMGGAWMIGHRLWNVLLGMRLSQAGVIVVGVDYRNYPSVEMHEMAEDVGRALDWVFANIADYGGDPKSVRLIGQSAGAHLEAMVLLERCMAEARGEAGSHGWSPKDLKGFFGVSGAYDLVALGPHLASRGIYNALPHLCADGDLRRHSPTHVLSTPAWRGVAAQAAARLPPVHLYAGELDQSVPAATSEAFARALRGAGAQQVSMAVGKGVRHAEPVVEDPLTGGDLQIELMLPTLPKEVGKKIKTLKPPYPQVPKLLARVALRVMPF